MGAMLDSGATQTILAVSLLVVILLLVAQTIRLRRRDQEFAVTTDALMEGDRLMTLGRLMAGVAHELNTPLAAVRCSVDTRQKAVTMIDAAVAGLADPAADRADHLARAQKALTALHSTDPVLQEALTRTNQLIRELRLAGRGEAEEPQPVDVNGLVRSTLLLLQHELKNSVAIQLDLGEVPPVPGWPGPLGQVLLNLVMNARQAVGERGTISIATALQGDKVVVTVQDDGPGLPTDNPEQLFKLGYTTKGRAEGTGLGLFITRKIMQRHQGWIKAANRAVGGAEFTVTVPTRRSAADCPLA